MAFIISVKFYLGKFSRGELRKKRLEKYEQTIENPQVENSLNFFFFKTTHILYTLAESFEYNPRSEICAVRRIRDNIQYFLRRACAAHVRGKSVHPLRFNSI